METVQNLKAIMIGKAYPDRFEIWKTILERADELEFHEKCQIYTDYVQEFPFTVLPWNYQAQLYAKRGENDKAYQIYEWGLQMNKSSWKLWESFCTWVESAFQDQDSVRKVYDMAMATVGRDYHAGALWEKYINYEERQNDPEKLNNLYWRQAQLPQKSLDVLKRRYKNFIENIADLSIVTRFAAQMNFLSQNSAESNPSMEVVKNTLTAYFDTVSGMLYLF